MGDKKWVCHISGQGEKWEVLSENDYEWNVLPIVKDASISYHELPKSEYHLCDPPEEWEDITKQCKQDQYYIGGSRHLLSLFNGKFREVVTAENCRLRKVRCAKADGAHNPDWAFVVERRKS